MFHEDLPKQGNMNNNIDCPNHPQLEWEYKLTQPTHGPSGLFWPMLQAFTYDGTTCPIRLNSYGPGGGWVLGTCSHMYHPQCIIPCMVQCRHCLLCWAPFHSRLYAMFNLKHCMPFHWEYNAQMHPTTRRNGDWPYMEMEAWSKCTSLSFFHVWTCTTSLIIILWKHHCLPWQIVPISWK